MTHPSRFFHSLGKINLEGTSAFLDAQQVYLRENKICGFIEIQLKPAEQVLLLFTPGVLAGTYHIESDNSKHLQLINLSTVWDGKSAPIRTVELAQTTARMMWLALESPIGEHLEFTGRDAFAKQMDSWKSAQFSGVVEAMTEKTQGIFNLQQGSVPEAESSYFNGNEFQHGLVFEQMESNEKIKAIVHKPNPASQSHQCLMLRRGMLQWSESVLARYQELAGQKLIRLMQENIKSITQPSGWNLFIQNSKLHDEHFFSYAQTAAQAYRAVLMEVGSQMDQVVGSALTQRILNDSFETLNKDTRMALELHRLIPAAFSA